MKQLFDKQTELNEFIFQKHRIGSWKAVVEGNDAVKSEWVTKMLTALHAETIELIERFHERLSVQSVDIREEFIDCVHFLISISQLVGVTPEEAENALEIGIVDFVIPRKQTYKAWLLMKIMWAKQHVQNSVSWKWWAKRNEINYKKAKEYTLALWGYYGYIVMRFGKVATAKEAMKYYAKKNKINFARQENGYKDGDSVNDHLLVIGDDDDGETD